MSNGACLPLVLALDDASATLQQVGGKGASLARMAAGGLPVPPGFHITTEAYCRFVMENGLQERIVDAVAAVAVDQPATLDTASRHVAQLFAQGVMPDEVAEAIRKAYGRLGSGVPVAVRSSATAEDLPEMSFAGQQESYLNIRGDAMLLDAVKRCWASLWTARAIGYRARHNISPNDVRLAVVVQELVPAEAAGIMFTANPLTGKRDQVVINAAWGLGEAIVGGQVTPDTLVVDKASGEITEQQINLKHVMTVRTPEGTREEAVSGERQAAAVLNSGQATELAHIGVQIEKLYGQPMDIEWALHDSRFFIVQARPITTLREQEVTTETWNDSLKGNYLWTNTNLGEAAPDVMTPCTWSLMQIFMADAISVTSVGDHSLVGNIGGRPYMNMSVLATLAGLFGFSRKRFAETTEQTFGRIPAGVEIPLVTISRWRALRDVLPIVVRLRRRVRANQKRLPAFLATAPGRCAMLHKRIAAISTSRELIALWHAEVLPLFHESSSMLEAAARRDGTAIVWVRRTLRRIVGEADTNALLSGLGSGSGGLASLGLLLGLTQLARGEINRETFAQQYGHRGPHEFEVSLPRPAEDPDWIERHLEGLREAKTDVTTLLARQKEAQMAAWTRFQQNYPRKAVSIQRKIEQASAAFRDREAARSEVIRVFWVLRAFVQRAGALTGQDDAIFFLSIDEIVSVLGGDTTPLAAIPIRRATYTRYTTLPPYPALIVGKFDPFAWAANPRRRNDIFDARGDNTPVSATITGFPGAEGIVEGQVRVIATVEESDLLLPGEILVTSVTNVGWTPLFPRAAAVVTDVGAPLSHAAIVARELGIPAVVGCGNATMRLHTGDTVRVNGGHGTVEVLT